MFKFKPFQRDDLARAAIHDGLIVGQDTGLGKTIALYVWPCLKLGFDSRLTGKGLTPNGAVLLVVPGDGHDQTSDEGQTHFKVRPVRLDSQATFIRLSTPSPATGKRRLPNGYYLTSYTQLADNGVHKFPKPEDVSMETLHLSEAAVSRFYDERGTHFRALYEILQSTPADSLSAIRARYFRLRKEYLGNDAVTTTLDRAFQTLEKITAASFAELTASQLAFLRAELIARKHLEYSAGIGESRLYSVSEHQNFRVKCVYSPSLADLSQEAFDCVCVDEGTRVKGETTLIGRGVRQMNPRFRLITTATPIKNRLPDIFRLA